MSRRPYLIVDTRTHNQFYEYMKFLKEFEEKRAKEGNNSFKFITWDKAPDEVDKEQDNE